MSDSEGETERTVVKTYVPAYQRDEWDDHADDLDMSRSEFVRSMVQAGRRGFEGADRPSPEDGDPDTDPTVTDQGEPQRRDDLESTILDVLSEDEYLSWDELLGVVTDDIEQRLEATLQDLQSDGRVRYSGRNGGYTIDR